MSMGFELEFMDVHSINIHHKKELNQLFNILEDLCYAYETHLDRLTEDEKGKIESYIIGVSKWAHENKDRFGDYEHHYLEVFKSIQTDLKSMDDIVAQFITPIHNHTLYNWLGYFKSSDAFYAVKGSHKIQRESNEKMDEILNKALLNAKKSIKTEKMAGYHLYIISGQASQDYKEKATGAYYKEKAEQALNRKDLDLIAPPGTYDGMVINNHEKVILFATTNEKTEGQDVFKVLKNEPNSKIVFVFAPTFNQSYSYVDTMYNGRKAEQHGTSFLKHFETDFSENELGDFNLLPFMALINNVKVPEKKGLKVTDFLKINPFAYGTDSYPMYRQLRNLNEYYEPERTEKLQEFFVDYALKITKRLAQIEPDFKLDDDTETILMNTQRMLLGVLYNFNASNLPQEVPQEKILKGLMECIQNYNTAVSKVDMDHSKISTAIESMELKMIMDQSDLIEMIKKRNKTIAVKYQEVPVPKKEVINGSMEKAYSEMFHEDCNIPKSKVKHLIELIKKRQQHVKAISFTTEVLTESTYIFFQKHKEIEPYKVIFKFIESGLDFNNPAVKDELSNVISMQRLEEEYEESSGLWTMKEKIEKVWKDLTDGSSYKMSQKLIEFLNKIDEAGMNGLNVKDVWNDNFYKNQISYKEISNSFWKNAQDNAKSRAHKGLMNILGLYSFNRREQSVLTSAELNQRLDHYLTVKKKHKIH